MSVVSLRRLPDFRPGGRVEPIRRGGVPLDHGNVVISGRSRQTLYHGGLPLAEGEISA